MLRGRAMLAPTEGTGAQGAGRMGEGGKIWQAGAAAARRQHNRRAADRHRRPASTRPPERAPRHSASFCRWDKPGAPRSVARKAAVVALGSWAGDDPARGRFLGAAKRAAFRTAPCLDRQPKRRLPGELTEDQTAGKDRPARRGPGRLYMPAGRRRSRGGHQRARAPLPPLSLC